MHYEGTYLGTMKPAAQGVLGNVCSCVCLFVCLSVCLLSLCVGLCMFFWLTFIPGASRHGRGRLRMPNYVYEATILSLICSPSNNLQCQGEFQNDLKHGLAAMFQLAACESEAAASQDWYPRLG